MLESDKHVILNFLCVHVLIRISPFLPLTDPGLTWAAASQLLKQTARHVPRWRLCLRAAARLLPSLFLRVANLVTGKAHSGINSFLGSVLKRTISHVDKISFLDDQTRVFAKRILEYVKLSQEPNWLREGKRISSHTRTLPEPKQSHKFSEWPSDVTKVVHSSRFHRKSSDAWSASPFATDCSYDLQLKTV